MVDDEVSEDVVETLTETLEEARAESIICIASESGRLVDAVSEKVGEVVAGEDEERASSN